MFLLQLLSGGYPPSPKLELVLLYSARARVWRHGAFPHPHGPPGYSISHPRAYSCLNSSHPSLGLRCWNFLVPEKNRTPHRESWEEVGWFRVNSGNISGWHLSPSIWLVIAVCLSRHPYSCLPYTGSQYLDCTSFLSW